MPLQQGQDVQACPCQCYLQHHCLCAWCNGMAASMGGYSRQYCSEENPEYSVQCVWLLPAVFVTGLTDFSKDIGLQSSAAVTGNATTKLIGMLHKFWGPDIKGFLSDVKPALLSAMDTEYEKKRILLRVLPLLRR